MDMFLRIAVAVNIVAVCMCQYYQLGTETAIPQHRPQPEPQYYRESLSHAPQPQIISHKQAQNHNGEFKYAFAAENGLAQGESIAPDGTRSGGYTYVDPSGKKISVKYTAGKEGFRILEGDHIPKAPASATPAPQHIYSAQPAYISYAKDTYDDGQYTPEKYSKPAPVYTPQASYIPQKPQFSQQPQYAAPYRQNSITNSNSLEEKDPKYYDDPGKPHTFGNGYSFEFGG